MSRLVARTNLFILPMLIALIGYTLQTAQAEEEASDFAAMSEECDQAGNSRCVRACLRAQMGHARFIEQCRAAYSSFKAQQSELAANGDGASTDETPSVGATTGTENAQATANQVTVMGVPLCGDVVEAGEHLEAQGYKNAAMLARSLRSINVTKRAGNDNYDFKINYGGPPKRDSIYIMSFHGGFQDGPNLFESEKSRFEQTTGIELTCNQYSTGPNQTRLECKYPPGEADRNRPGFSYSIAHEEGQKAFFVDASAWGYEDCG